MDFVPLSPTQKTTSAMAKTFRLRGKLRLNRPFNQNFLVGWYVLAPEHLLVLFIALLITKDTAPCSVFQVSIWLSPV